MRTSKMKKADLIREVGTLRAAMKAADRSVLRYDDRAYVSVVLSQAEYNRVHEAVEDAACRHYDGTQAWTGFADDWQVERLLPQFTSYVYRATRDPIDGVRVTAIWGAVAIGNEVTR